MVDGFTAKDGELPIDCSVKPISNSTVDILYHLLKRLNPFRIIAMVLLDKAGPRALGGLSGHGGARRRVGNERRQNTDVLRGFFDQEWI
jgi:hypothetical protein